jgi:hypothetical protein
MFKEKEEYFYAKRQTTVEPGIYRYGFSWIVAVSSRVIPSFSEAFDA